MTAARLLGLAALGLLACAPVRTPGGSCAVDADCGAPASAWECFAERGTCLCRGDEACGPTEACNAAGYCQDRAGCLSNADCPDATLFCEVSTGACLARGRCSADVHCPLGEVCDRARGRCVEGCRDTGDCPGSACRCGAVPCACAADSEDARAACAVGVCDPSFCDGDGACAFGQLCEARPDAGVEGARCHDDFDYLRRPYCAPCPGGGSLQTCGVGANFCIIDTRTSLTYCGVDCSDGQRCPRGYGCRDIRVVYTRWECSSTRPCPGNPALPCRDDADCRLGGRCTKGAGETAGSCAGECRLKEGADFGYCSCLVDDDCPQQQCSGGECTTSRKPCVDADDCRAIRCAEFDGVGGCVIGQNCTPANGLSCLEVGR